MINIIAIMIQNKMKIKKEKICLILFYFRINTNDGQTLTSIQVTISFLSQMKYSIHNLIREHIFYAKFQGCKRDTGLILRFTSLISTDISKDQQNKKIAKACYTI